MVAHSYGRAWPPHGPHCLSHSLSSSCCLQPSHHLPQPYLASLSALPPPISLCLGGSPSAIPLTPTWLKPAGWCFLGRKHFGGRSEPSGCHPSSSWSVGAGRGWPCWAVYTAHSWPRGSGAGVRSQRGEAVTSPASSLRGDGNPEQTSPQGQLPDGAGAGLGLCGCPAARPGSAPRPSLQSSGGGDGVAVGMRFCTTVPQGAV